MSQIQIPTNNLPYFIINTDGASRGNPGHAAVGFVIQTADGVIWAQESVYLGHATNNEAEYLAVKLAFEKLLKDFVHKLPSVVELRADSQLISSQLSGKFKIKNQRLKILYERVKSLEVQIGEVNYVYTPRSQNSLADKLANNALDKQLLK